MANLPKLCYVLPTCAKKNYVLSRWIMISGKSIIWLSVRGLNRDLEKFGIENRSVIHDREASEIDIPKNTQRAGQSPTRTSTKRAGRPRGAISRWGPRIPSSCERCRSRVCGVSNSREFFKQLNGRVLTRCCANFRTNLRVDSYYKAPFSRF